MAIITEGVLLPFSYLDIAPSDNPVIWLNSRIERFFSLRILFSAVPLGKIITSFPNGIILHIFPFVKCYE